MAQTYSCPVRGMSVAPDAATPKSQYNGQTSYFCSDGDKQTFDKNPERYAGQK